METYFYQNKIHVSNICIFKILRNMIPTFDLRIGNWITVSGVSYRISAISETKVYFKARKGAVIQEELHPIPITQELLEKAGFKQRGTTDLFDKIPNEGFTYQMHSNKIMLFHSKDNTLCHWLNTRIVFLHQLQNFYYHLTGREIQISF